MSLVEIKSKYDGKCSACGRDLKIGWNIAYDKDTKQTYCIPCSKKMKDGIAETEQTIVAFRAKSPNTCDVCGADIEIDSTYYYNAVKNEICCENCGKQILEAIQSPEKAILSILDEIASNVMLMNNLIPAIHTQLAGINEYLNDIDRNMANIQMSIDSQAEKPVKEKPAKKE
jgi:hypothetical protein